MTFNIITCYSHYEKWAKSFLWLLKSSSSIRNLRVNIKFLYSTLKINRNNKQIKHFHSEIKKLTRNSLNRNRPEHNAHFWKNTKSPKKTLVVLKHKTFYFRRKEKSSCQRHTVRRVHIATDCLLVSTDKIIA